MPTNRAVRARLAATALAIGLLIACGDAVAPTDPVVTIRSTGFEFGTALPELQISQTGVGFQTVGQVAVPASCYGLRTPVLTRDGSAVTLVLHVTGTTGVCMDAAGAVLFDVEVLGMSQGSYHVEVLLMLNDQPQLRRTAQVVVAP